MIYLASPYSHMKQHVEQSRYEAVRGIVAHFTPRVREPIFSPILYCHDLHRSHNMGGTYAHWRRFNISMLRMSNELWVLQLDGWQQSVGVHHEIDFALRAEITVKYLDENGVFVV
jgi:hypothetical protein